MAQGKKWIVPKGMKFCPRCKQTKLLEEFSFSTKSPDGRFTYCRPCLKEKNQQRSPELRHKWHIKQHYGLTDKEYMEMFKKQKGKCFICHKVEVKGRSLAVDHDHKTGKVRSLLCTSCNTLVGIVEKSKPNILETIIEYLDKYK